MRALALEGLGVLTVLNGDLAEGEAHMSEALRLFRGQGDIRGTAESLINLGLAARQGGDFGRAEALCREAAELARAADEAHLVALTANNLAELAADRQEYDQAVERLEEAARIYEQLGDKGWQAITTLTRGILLVTQGRLDDAARSFAAALTAVDELPQREQAAFGLVGVAAILGHEDDGALAAQLVGAADALLEAVGASWDRGYVSSERVIREQALAAARECLEHGVYEAAYSAGRELTFDQAAAKALEALAQRKSP